MTIIDDDKIISLGKLLSQPLISTLEADFYTAQRFVQFITEYGLEKVDNVPPEEGENAALSQVSGSNLSGSLKLKMVTFLYRQIDPSDRQEKLFRVQVPLISLIPLPLLQIERAEFDFNIRIFSEIDLSTRIARDGGLKGESPPQEPFVGFKARLSPAIGSSESGEIAPTLDANMKIKVQMRQADLPGGLAYWMSTFTNATSVNEVEVPQPDSEDESSESPANQGSDSSPPSNS
ncbi:MAG: DUF2589 domain-containing protein [Crocosphaera sp.]|nr:DUF2589 domain-containing protein [Crocosphaera sp.]